MSLTPTPGLGPIDDKSMSHIPQPEEKRKSQGLGHSFSDMTKADSAPKNKFSELVSNIKKKVTESFKNRSNPLEAIKGYFRKSPTDTAQVTPKKSQPTEETRNKQSEDRKSASDTAQATPKISKLTEEPVASTRNTQIMEDVAALSRRMEQANKPMGVIEKFRSDLSTIKENSFGIKRANDTVINIALDLMKELADKEIVNHPEKTVFIKQLFEKYRAETTEPGVVFDRLQNEIAQIEKNIELLQQTPPDTEKYKKLISETSELVLINTENIMKRYIDVYDEFKAAIMKDLKPEEPPPAELATPRPHIQHTIGDEYTQELTGMRNEVYASVAKTFKNIEEDFTKQLKDIAKERAEAFPDEKENIETLLDASLEDQKSFLNKLLSDVKSAVLDSVIEHDKKLKKLYLDDPKVNELRSELNDKVARAQELATMIAHEKLEELVDRF